MIMLLNDDNCNDDADDNHDDDADDNDDDGNSATRGF